MSKESQEQLTGLKEFFEKKRKQKETVDARYFEPDVWLFENRPSKNTPLPRIDEFHKVSLSTHCAGLSFSGAKTSGFKVIDNVKQGYIYTGKELSELNKIDMLVPSAAVIDITAFLRVVEGDLPVYQHLLNDTDCIKQALNLSNDRYDRLRNEVLKLSANSNTRDQTVNPLYTHALVPQVYFPIDLAQDQYILISPLPPISLLNQVKQFVYTHLYGKETEESRKAFFSRKPHSKTITGFNQLVKLKYGGSQPQNISALNNENTGRFIHILCEPPNSNFKQIPKNNFFSMINRHDCQWNIDALSKLVRSDYSNQKIRDSINYHIVQIADIVFLKVFEINSMEPGWSDQPNVALPEAQKIWLDSKYHEERKESNLWMADIAKEFSLWLISLLERDLKFKNIDMKMSDDDYIQIKNHFVKALAKSIKYQMEYL